MQGVLFGHPELSHKGVLVSKALVTCMQDHIVFVKILNPGNELVHIQKGTNLAKFEICNNTNATVTVKSFEIEIRQLSKPLQWRHVIGKLNPADMVSTGSSVSNLKTNEL